MTEPPVEPTPYPWLPIDDVLQWLQLDAEHEHAAIAEYVRRAAASFCENQRRDLVTLVDDVPTFAATDDIVLAGVLLAGRFYHRRSSPAGIASYAELGAAEILRLDPDVPRLLGVGRYGVPVVG